MTEPRLTLEQATDFFATVFHGRHHIPSQLRDDGGGCFSIHSYWGVAGIATFDDDTLTRLVLLAHERCVRVSISPNGPRYLRIWVTARDPSATSMMLTHATIEEAIARFRTPERGGWPALIEKSRTPEARWAAMSPTEQWALINCAPTKILGPWVRLNPDSNLEWWRWTVNRRGGYAVFELNTPSGRAWFATSFLNTPFPSARQAMAFADDALLKTPPWGGYAIVGGIPDEVP